MSGLVVIKALDGRYNFGPAELAEVMASDEHGTFPTLEAARAAMPTTPGERPRGCSFGCTGRICWRARECDAPGRRS